MHFDRLDDDAASSLMDTAGSGFSGSEIPGLADAAHDEELFAFLAGEDGAGKPDTGPRYLKWLPGWCPSVCLVLSVLGAVFLVSLASLGWLVQARGLRLGLASEGVYRTPCHVCRPTRT